MTDITNGVGPARAWASTRTVGDAARDLRGQFEDPDFWDRSRTELDNWIEQAAVVLYGTAAICNDERGRWSELRAFADGKLAQAETPMPFGSTESPAQRVGEMAAYRKIRARMEEIETGP